MDGQKMAASIPLAIVAAGAMIAISIYLVWSGTGGGAAGGESPTITVPKVTDADHILGNPNAPITIIEYSDLDCQFCKQFHVTMKQVMASYGATGKVAWVYRQFPIAELHPNAPALAEASECVAKSGGNAAFWKFIDAVFSSAPGNDRFDMERLDAMIQLSGSSLTDVKNCITAGTFKKLVASQFADASKSGGQGTPHNIIISKSGRTVPVPGSQPYATISSILDTLLSE